MTERTEVGVRLHFYSKPLSQWSDEDRRVMLQKIRALFKWGRKRPARRRKAK
jgi:hypothetical protein